MHGEYWLTLENVKTGTLKGRAGYLLPVVQACVSDYYYDSDKLKCIPCEDSAKCTEHTTLQSMVVRKHFYRFERNDDNVYPCPRAHLCLKSSNRTEDNAYRCRCFSTPLLACIRMPLQVKVLPSCACREGSEGPACAICKRGCE